MLTVDQARDWLLQRAQPVRTSETLPLLQALGRILAEPVLAGVDVPPQDNSAMDGYALRCADGSGPLPVSQRIPAGTQPQPLQAGTAARIFTGAPIPAGADAVVGSHPHVVQDTESYRGKPIIYSLGNFVFDGFESPSATTGAVLEMSVTRRGVASWRMVNVHLDRDGSPHPE
jgi:hypothetical protein